MYKIIFIILFLLNISFTAMIKPSNGDYLNYTHVLFEWEQMNDATSYNFQLDNNDSFEEPLLEINNESLIYIETNLIDWESSYFWRIQPEYQDGSTGNWESIFNFSTSSPRSEAYSINYEDDDYIIWVHHLWSVRFIVTSVLERKTGVLNTTSFRYASEDDRNDK